MSLVRLVLPAFRLKTLPLAFSSILVGTALAVADDSQNWQPVTFVLTVLTALALQILSNVANDLGDSLKGTDQYQLAAQPDGLTKRVTGLATVSVQRMRIILLGWVILTLILGSMLIIHATKTSTDFWIFLGLGGLSIVAALTYTIGKYAYGYYGLGDVSVFIFFGLTGVLGSYYLQANHFHFSLILPAIAVGLFCVAVLNINNLRDIETDRLSGKQTFAVYIGKKNGQRYHIILITLALLAFLCSVSPRNVFTGLFLLTVPLFFRQSYRLYQANNSKEIGKELPICIKLVFLCCALFSVGQITLSLCAICLQQNPTL